MTTEEWVGAGEAAEMLGVSRAYFVGQILGPGRLMSRPAGADRQIPLDDFNRFKQGWDRERLAAMDELVDLSQDLGLYE